MADIYQIIPYPDMAYQVDEPAQSRVREFARHKDRWLKRTFIGMSVAFGLAITLGFAHWGTGALTGLLAFLALFAFEVVLVFSTPRDRACAKCGKRLKTVWPETSGGFAAEYRICRQCRLFRYMFRTSRR